LRTVQRIRGVGANRAKRSGMTEADIRLKEDIEEDLR